jgi:hypothetical protein
MQDLREVESEEFRLNKDGYDLTIRMELVQRKLQEQELVIEILENRTKERFKIELRHSNFFKMNNKSGLFSLFWLKLMLSVGFRRMCDSAGVASGKANSAFSLKILVNIFFLKQEDITIFNPVGVEQNLFLKIKKYNKTLDPQTINFNDVAGILLEVCFDDGMSLNLKFQVPRVIKHEKKALKLETIRRVQDEIKKAFFEWKACGESKNTNTISEPPSNQIRSYQNVIEHYISENHRLMQENQIVKKNLFGLQAVFQQANKQTETKGQGKGAETPLGKD